ncbi:MAG TPA: DUF952 domain-containing protein [Beijerinckiaceae bacterium]|nr:DUF952 domain-containing protein [Beijerinckiaceae bacterium]
MTLVYKIASAELWRIAEARGDFTGAPVDVADGFIHLSSAQQVRETAAKHFSGQSDLILIAVEAVALGAALKWEISRGGALFPHLYGPLSMQAVHSAKPVPLDANGVHVFDELLP